MTYIYIIAHGTVNGYRKITQVAPIGTEQNVLTDIRTEFDNTQTMLDKPFGYLIQMAEKGVWLSIVKLLFDGERSGNGKGFWAFSAFIPNNQIVDGKVIKQTLENLLTHYLTIIGDDFTKNVGVDWSFVERATDELNKHCKPRRKPAPTNYKKDSIEYAYIKVNSEEKIAQYLEKPFQPEYGKYRAVFLGTHLQNPAHLAAQKSLDIDFGNEVYDIIWQGDEKKYLNLPQSICKKDIETKTFNLSRECYIPVTIRFSDGSRDDSNATITLSIPKLEPQKYVVQFSINSPDAVSSITATNKSDCNSQQRAEDKHSLVFKGEDASSTWHVVFKTTDKYDDYEEDIVPSKISNEIHIVLKKKSTKTKKEGSPDRKIEVRVPNRYNINQISYDDGSGKKSISQNDDAKDNGEYTSYRIRCNGHPSRDKFSFYLDNKELRCRKVDDNCIEIIGTYNILHRALDWLRNYYRYIIYGFVGLLLVLLLSGLILFILDKYGYVDVKQWIHISEQENGTGIENSANDRQTASIDHYDSVRCELDSVYQEQKSLWNMSKCKHFCEKYEDMSQCLREKDSIAYMRLKQLSWLWRTREKIETGNWDSLKTFVKDESSWTAYSTDTIKELISQIILPANMDNRKAFWDSINADADFGKKNFTEVRNLWNECQNQSQSSTSKTSQSNHSAKKVPKHSESKDKPIEDDDKTIVNSENF